MAIPTHRTRAVPARMKVAGTRLGDQLGDGLSGLDPVAQVTVDDPVRAAAEGGRQDVQAALIGQERLGHRTVAVEDPEPAAELHHPVAGLLDERRVRVGRLQAPAPQPGVDLLLGDALVALELGLRAPGRCLHQQEADDDDGEQERDQAEGATDDELRHRGPPGVWVGSTSNASELTLRAVPRQGPLVAAPGRAGRCPPREDGRAKSTGYADGGSVIEPPSAG